MADTKKETKLGIEAKKTETDYPDWYSQVCTRAELIEYYDVSGCYIIRPWAYKMWQIISGYFDREIEKMGVEDLYFPMFVSKGALEKEKDHLEGFAPEVAWVTKSGDSDLQEPIAIRPTSETVMYPTFAKWIRSHRDLPLRINQWCNIVRWEFSHPTPFIRTREFLWQEGHTAFAKKEEAETEVRDILRLYASVYQDYLAIPVVQGKKTIKETFAGADYTTTVEAFVPVNGRAVQGATSHHLGQSFSKMFNITFEDPQKGDGSKAHVYQNSWGLTTRTLGVLIMVHGDDNGLVLPPKVSPVQVIIVPVGLPAKATEELKEKVYTACKKIQSRLEDAGIRARADDRTNVTSGWKFAHWETKGVPLRLEVGPKDLEKNTAFAARRDKPGKENKFNISLDNLEDTTKEVLMKIQSDMLENATKERDEHIVKIEKWENFTPTLNKKNMILSPCCGKKECEIEVKKKSAAESAVVQDEKAPSMGAKGLCIPFEQPQLEPGTKCIITQEDAQFYILFGRSY